MVFTGLKRVTVNLPDLLHKEVKKYAADNDIYMNEIYVQAIRDYLEEKKQNK